MPLPAPGTVWPPRPLKHVTPHLRTWDAWYTGDPIKLAETYGYVGPGVPGFPVPRQSQWRGGVIGAVSRFFWGQPNGAQQLNRLHVPIAADLCQAAADLLYSEQPTFTIEADADGGSKAQDRLTELVDDTLLGVLGEGTEIGAALGGHYLRVCWDTDVADRPFLDARHADQAWPEFRYGHLTAVTFWTVVQRDGQQVWRHLERHETQGAGASQVGVIRHGLYLGSETDLGRLVPLTDVPETAPLKDYLTDGNIISTESPGLGCVYIPNMRPQRRWRNDPAGRNLGRSTLDGVEHLMDGLDETYSSWMRDIRIGKGRIFVAKQLLEDQGPGQGATWDADQEVYASIKHMPGENATTLPIQAEQFDIRFAEHAATADKLVENILRTAGFSPQTFGMDAASSDGRGNAADITATEITARERKSYMTRDRMIRLAKPQVAAILEKLLAVDAAIFKSGVTPSRPNVEFADAVQESMLTLAQTAQALDTARAASIRTRVQLVHPDWDDKAIDAEVTLIKAEEALGAPTLGMPGDPPVDNLDQ